MNLNKAFILGNVTRDPEIRQTPGGQTVCSFSVATNRVYTDKMGQRQKEAEFHNIVAWGRQAEIINQYSKKGSLLLIEGRIQTRSWQDQQGAKHWKTEIIAERIQLGPRNASTGGGGGGYDASPQDDQPDSTPKYPEETPIIEIPDDGPEINVKDIPF